MPDPNETVTPDETITDDPPVTDGEPVVEDTDPDPDETPQSDEPSAEQQLWEKALPEFAGNYDEFTSKQREKLLAQRLAAISAEEARPAGESDKDTQESSGPQSGKPSIPEPPAVDLEGITSRLTDVLGEKEAAAIVEPFRAVKEYADSSVQLLGAALVEQDKRLDALEDQTLIPRQFETALPTVKGAQQSDIAPARKILRSGDVRTAELALKVAVANRQAEAAGVTEPTPSDDSKARARSLRASREAGLTRAPGETPTKMPATPADLAALMRREEAAKQNK